MEKKDTKNGQRRKDSSQTDLWKGIPRNRQRLWNKIPSRELKAMLGYRPLNNRMVEITDEEGNCNLYDNMRRAAIENGLSN